MKQNTRMIEMQPPRLMDYHMHTAVTIDGRMNEIEACERALSQGLREIAFTSQLILNQPDYTISPEAFVAHWDQIQSCQQRYPMMKIRVGIEMDYYPGREQEIAASLRNYEELINRPFDFVLGSIHELKGVFFSNKHQAAELFRDCDLIALYLDYFDLAAQAVQSQLFDIMAHPDLIKKYTHVLTSPVPFDTYRPAVELFIDALLESSVGIEVNTKGRISKMKETYPSHEFLELYLSKAKSSGIEPILTLGSDAHKVDEVGGYILEEATILRKLGVGKLASFEKRMKSPFEM